MRDIMEAPEFNRLLKELTQDTHAIEKMYSFYYPRIVQHIGRKYGHILAEDVAQEFFLKLIQICDTQAYVEHPTSWVYACAENIAKRKLRNDSKYTYSSIEVVAANAGDPINKILTKDILDKLNDKERQIIYLFYWEGYNQNEIAHLVKLTPSNVRQIHSRAIKKIKKYI